MVRKRVQLLHDHMRAAALAEEAIRQHFKQSEKVYESRAKFPTISFNESDVWVIFAMTGWLDEGDETVGVPKSATALASQLGFGRDRTLMRLRTLIDQDLVFVIGPTTGGDKRCKLYLLTPVGRSLASWLFSEVAQLEATIRKSGGIRRNARAMDAQQVVLALCDGNRNTETTKWLDRRRLGPSA